MPSKKGGRAFYNLDRELRFLSANDTALALWGKSRQEVVGREMEEVFPEARGSEAMEAHLEALRSFRPYRGILKSPFLGFDIDLEIYPSSEGLRVSFAPISTQPNSSAERDSPR